MAREPFLEVVGEGQVVEQATRFLAEISVAARGGRKNVAAVAARRAEVIALLRAAGFADEEVADAGTDISQDWYNGPRKGTVTHRLLLRTDTLPRLRHGLEALTPLAERQERQFRFNVDMKQPEFAAPPGHRPAVEEAYRAARAEAEPAAAAMGATLGRVLWAKEERRATRASGFGADVDWSGDSDRFAVLEEMREGPPGGMPPALTAPGRAVWVQMRFRFELLYPVREGA